MEENRPPAAEEPRNPHVRHEPADVNAMFLTKFGIGMALIMVVFLFGLAGLFWYFAKRAQEATAPQPMAAARQKQPPEPRLQPHPSQDLRRMRADEDEILHQYAWIDPDKGIVRVPGDRAMDRILENSLLPVRPNSGGPPNRKTP